MSQEFTIEEILDGCTDLRGSVECLTCSRLLGYVQSLLRAQDWQPIETAPKGIHSTSGSHNYGKRILAFPVRGEVAAVCWWTSQSGGNNWLDDGGSPVTPTRWMRLPDPPRGEKHE